MSEHAEQSDTIAEIDEALIARATKAMLDGEDVQLAFAIEQHGALGLSRAISALRGGSDPRVAELKAVGERARIANRAADPYLSWLREVPVLGVLAEKHVDERTRFAYLQRKLLRDLGASAKRLEEALGSK